MPEGSGYDVLTTELETHAHTVDGLVERLQEAVAAAQQVTMDNSAYGVICQSFALMIDPFEQMGVQALQTAQTSVADTAAGLRDTVNSYTSREHAHAQAFTTLGEALDG
jgi:methylmalonyl-CoA mutase cobalamin-binding subunit